MKHMIYLDISKASDRVCHNSLEEKMKKYEPGASKIM